MSRCELEAGLAKPRKDAVARDQLELRSLAMDSAIELVRREAGDIQVSRQQAEQLAGVCGCNALALTIIGGFIACERVTPDVRPPCSQME